MGLQYTNFFENEDYECDTQIILCKQCSCHLCLSNLIISDSFTGGSGQAYLVDKLINFTLDEKVEESQMKTGRYLIRKVRCHQCNTILGWTYKKSFDYRESYKEGKFVIERAYLNVIENNSSTKNLIELAKQNYRRRLSSNATLYDEEEFKFSDGNMKYINRLRLQNVAELDNEGDVLVEL